MTKVTDWSEREVIRAVVSALVVLLDEMSSDPAFPEKTKEGAKITLKCLNEDLERAGYDY